MSLFFRLIKYRLQ